MGSSGDSLVELIEGQVQPHWRRAAGHRVSAQRRLDRPTRSRDHVWLRQRKRAEKHGLFERVQIVDTSCFCQLGAGLSRETLNVDVGISRR